MTCRSYVYLLLIHLSSTFIPHHASHPCFRGRMTEKSREKGLTSRWNTSPSSPRNIHSAHTEFVMGAAWALFDPGLLASCAWDQEIHLFRA